MNSNNFNINRLSNFIQRQIALNTPPMLIAAGAVSGTLLIVSLLVAYYNGHELENLKGFYLTVFFVGGYIFTSNIFSELHTPQKSYFYLTLPVSTLEKTIGSWLLSSVAYTIVFQLVTGIIYMITRLAAGQGPTLTEFFNRDYFLAVGVYFVTQTIFFLGASYFRKYNFLKTLLALFLIQVAIGLYAGGLGWLLFRGEPMNNNSFTGEFEFAVEHIIPQVAKFLFWYVFAPFMLVVSYFSLKEREV